MTTIFRTVLFSFMLISASYTHAQHGISELPYSPKKVTFGIRGGLNISNLTTNYDNEVYNEKVKFGYNIGATMDCHLAKDFYIRTGLGLTSKGAIVKDLRFEEVSYESKMNAVYLQVPIYFAYKTFFRGTSDMKVSIAGGPYVAYGVAGQSTQKTQTGTVVGKADTFGDGWVWNKPDIGVGIEVSLEVKKIVFTLGTEGGLTRAWKSDAFQGNPYTRNSASYLSVGYNF